NLTPLVQKKIVPVVTGFIGATKNGRVTTLGRGGSDYSAAIIGYCLNAREVQIWTDVDGVFSADPRLVKNAKQLQRITYKEASELAAFGAKVLHPRTIRPLIPENIPIVIKNTFNPSSAGTYINGRGSGNPRIAAIASKPKVTLVNLYSLEMLLSKGFLEKIFAVFAKHNISVDLVSVSEVSVSVTLDNREDLQGALQELKDFAITSTNQVGVISLIGENILETDGVLKNVFSILSSAKVPVRMLSLGASDINISIVTDPVFVSSAVNVLHDGIISKDKEGKIS
ncbi:MAG: aspartate kinase, partial [Candidatus Levybacteria bacterium]|nr:aspartate kinase [Candidatus Levybacteria bacterium]